MNKNVHLTSLFYIRQNCETALSISNVLIYFKLPGSFKCVL